MEEKYLIGIIDNDKSNLHELQNIFDDDFSSVAIDLKNNLDEFIEITINRIIKEGIRAVIIDFSLSDNTSERSFNGADVMKKLHSKLYKFPAVIITAHSEIDAESKAENPYLVFEKGSDIAHDTEGKIEFIRKLKRLIERYNLELDEMENEYKELINNSEQSLQRDERLFIIENNLMSSVRKEFFSAISKSKKSFQYLENLENTADLLLKRLNEIKTS